MKKIGILTFHRALNYGAVLQAYALEKKIKDLDKESCVELIDYRCRKIENSRNIKSKLKPFSLKNTIKSGALIWKVKKFNNFLNVMKISKEKYYENNMRNIDNEYDKVIVGSDQVWNYTLTDKDYTYLLNFIEKDEKKYSYAASIGLKNFAEEEKIYSEYLKRFNKISVRERESEAILNDIGVNINGVHLDPTLLLTGKEWLEELNVKKECKEKYILVYNIPKPNKMLEVAEELSNKTNCKIIFIPNGIMPKSKNGKIVFPNVKKFIELFANAEYVITNSFHGTVFSILFEKKFLVELQENGKANARIETLLKICNLENKILNINNNDEICNEINWKIVNEGLSKARKESEKYLLEILND